MTTSSVNICSYSWWLAGFGILLSVFVCIAQARCAARAATPARMCSVPPPAAVGQLRRECTPPHSILLGEALPPVVQTLAPLHPVPHLAAPGCCPFLQCISSRGRSCAAGAALAALVGTIWWLGGAITLMSKHGRPATGAVRACRLCVQTGTTPARPPLVCAAAPLRPRLAHETPRPPSLKAPIPLLSARS